jgi:hypothetical protein
MNNLGFIYIKFSFCYLPVSMRAGSSVRLLVFRILLHRTLRLKPSFISSNSVLILLVLVGSSIVCRTSVIVVGCRAP